jgi:hypothetical protein
MSDIGPVTPNEKKQYEEEYQQSVQLFQNALNQNAEAQNPYQQQQYQDVMEQAMHILNQAARGLKRSDLLAQNRRIADDYQAYLNNPSQEAQQKLIQDLNTAQKSIG